MELEKGLPMREMDGMDSKIIERLKENGRASYSEIAEQVGISRVAVKNRVKVLEEAGYIQGYTIKSDAAPMNANSVKFILDITTTVDKYEAILDYLAAMPAITEVYAVTGECKIHAVGIALNQQNVQPVVKAIYRNAEGIQRIVCQTVLSVRKDIRGGVDGRSESEVSRDREE